MKTIKHIHRALARLQDINTELDRRYTKLQEEGQARTRVQSQCIVRLQNTANNLRNELECKKRECQDLTRRNQEIAEQRDAAEKKKANNPVYVWGTPGGGKSWVQDAVTEKKANTPVYVTNAGSMLAPNEDSVRVEPKMAWIPRSSTGTEDITDDTVGYEPKMAGIQFGDGMVAAAAPTQWQSQIIVRLQDKVNDYSRDRQAMRERLVAMEKHLDRLHRNVTDGNIWTTLRGLGGSVGAAICQASTRPVRSK